MRRSDESYPVRRDRGWGMMPREQGGSLFDSPLMGGSPWQMMRRMQEDMDRLFGQFFGGQMGNMGQAGQEGGMPAPMGARWNPSLDVSETEKEWCIEADLPGITRDDIQVDVQNHHLLVRAEMRQEQADEGKERQYHRRERRYGMFQQVFPLPENVNEEEIRCEFRNGVLSIHVPKTEQTQPQSRRIPVGEGAAQAQTGQRSAASAMYGTQPTGTQASGTQGMTDTQSAMHETEEEEDRQPTAAGPG